MWHAGRDAYLKLFGPIHEEGSTHVDVKRFEAVFVGLTTSRESSVRKKRGTASKGVGIWTRNMGVGKKNQHDTTREETTIRVETRRDEMR